MRRVMAVLAVATVIPLTLVSPSAAAHHARCHGGANWRMYGYDVRHSFDVRPGCSSITTSNVATLAPAWFFHTKDSITASVAVSHRTAYVGSWDGTFYAINAKTGKLRWSFHIKPHAANAFGRIVSTAWVGHAGRGRHRRRVVLFGGSSNVWALNATNGRKLATINLDPRTKADRRGAGDRVVEVESSPAVLPARHGRRHIFIGMDIHDDSKLGRTGLVALTLRRHHGWQLRPRWKYDVETDRVYRGRPGLTHGSGHGVGCGGIWSSPAIDPAHHVVVFGTANCDNPAQAYRRHLNYSEELVALRTRTGKRRWSFRPAASLPKAQRIPEAERDADFGASANVFRLAGRAVVGDGSKSAKYYVRRERDGRKVSTADAGTDGYAQNGFAVGGFIGSSAITRGRDKAVIGGTAIPLPRGVTDVSKALWDVRSMNPRTGKLNWVYQLGAPTYGATSVVNGVSFTTLTVQSDVVALNAKTGAPLAVLPVLGPPSSTAVVAGDSLYVGTGTRETDLEYKAVSDQLENALKDTIGESPLSPVSGVQAYRLAAHLGK
ncbi:MAG: PQQ-binding-like beta-propeller repeat protein [Frankiaceae bacterium]|nr:PQQ-binding-like beta-propeller repeat protein [Frankiaceae bacterium]